jgi:hypothetical protein
MDEELRAANSAHADSLRNFGYLEDNDSAVTGRLALLSNADTLYDFPTSKLLLADLINTLIALSIFIVYTESNVGLAIVWLFLSWFSGGGLSHVFFAVALITGKLSI